MSVNKKFFISITLLIVIFASASLVKYNTVLATEQPTPQIISIDNSFGNNILPYYIPGVSGGKAEKLEDHWTVNEQTKSVTRVNDLNKEDVIGQYAVMYLNTGYYNYFELEVKIKPNFSNAGIAGIVFGSKNMDVRYMASGNAVYFQPDPSIELSGSTITVKKSSSKLAQPNSYYTLKLIVQKNKVEAYVDGRLQISSEYAPEIIMGGRIGLFSANISTSFYDNIILYTLDENGKRINAKQNNDLVEQINIKETDITIPLGSPPQPLIYSVKPDTAYDKCINWLSENPDVAVADINGNIYALKEGVAKIYAISNDGGLKDSVNITVEKQTVLIEKVALNHESYSGAVGGKFYLVAEILPGDAENDGFKWSSSDSSVAMVNNGTVTLIGEGECNITVYDYKSEMSAVCRVTVKKDDVKKGCGANTSLPIVVALIYAMSVAMVLIKRGNNSK